MRIVMYGGLYTSKNLSGESLDRHGDTKNRLILGKIKNKKTR